jgi:hypothetical protein
VKEPAFEKLTEDAIAALGIPATFRAYAALDDRSRTAQEVACLTGSPVEETQQRLATLVASGLVDVDACAAGHVTYRARYANVADEAVDPATRVQFRLAMLSVVVEATRAARRALLDRADTTNVGCAFVTLPESAETFRAAMAILAEAEEKLRALARAAPAGTARFQATLMLGGT